MGYYEKTGTAKTLFHLMKDKDIQLVKDHRVASSNARARRIDMYYIIMVALIVGIIIV